jgi:oligoribonuclease
MTGLEERDQIIEFAAIATDGNLNPFDEGINFIIKTDKAVLDNMNEWCVEQHGSVRCHLYLYPSSACS